MKKEKLKKKVKMKFFADLNFDLSQDEVWEELSSHNDLKKSADIPIKVHLLRSLSDINTLFHKKNNFQLNLF
jgi:hypothetical protein